MRRISLLLLACLGVAPLSARAAQTWNPSDVAGTGTYTGGNLIFTSHSGQTETRSTTKFGNAGCKTYFEVALRSASTGDTMEVAVVLSTRTLNGSVFENFDLTFGNNETGVPHGNIILNGATAGHFDGNASTALVTYGFALDFTSRQVWVWSSQTSQWNASGTAAPGGTGGVSISGLASSNSYLLGTRIGNSGGFADTSTLNAGASAFVNTIPAGYTALNSATCAVAGAGGALFPVPF